MNYVMIDDKKIELSNETVTNLKKELGVKDIPKPVLVDRVKLMINKNQFTAYPIRIAIGMYPDSLDNLNGDDCQCGTGLYCTILSINNAKTIIKTLNNLINYVEGK